MGAIISLTVTLVSAMIAITMMVIKFGIRLTLMLFNVTANVIKASARQ
ncbi:hypothetical protein NE236_01270 [Actinoallomurus purpureus]|nr:hypothetical protein [Actinoallomurus purpureus]MCO6003601.1 hypothetical protein [Actinoallomurus purpureus]